MSDVLVKVLTYGALAVFFGLFIYCFYIVLFNKKSAKTSKTKSSESTVAGSEHLKTKAATRH
ncbi:hypothetical protein L0128_22680 [candidate division KSB1 bacterium]|nr:hypothetical protein [candidate division KSB1 bacterium]